jgi:hypothetical protein
MSEIQRTGGIKVFPSEPTPLSDLSSSSLVLSFGDVNVNSSSTQYFSLRNNSKAPIDFAINAVPSGFSVSPTTGRIAPGGSASISVTFRPSEVKNYSEYINVTPGVSSVAVTGRGKKQ